MSEPTQTRRDFLRATGATMAAASRGAAGVPSLPLLASRPQTPPAKNFGYAVVGLGGLSMSDILPAFAHTSRRG